LRNRVNLGTCAATVTYESYCLKLTASPSPGLGHMAVRAWSPEALARRVSWLPLGVPEESVTSDWPAPALRKFLFAECKDIALRATDSLIAVAQIGAPRLGVKGIRPRMALSPELKGIYPLIAARQSGKWDGERQPRPAPAR
jgi:hypothetical protein